MIQAVRGTRDMFGDDINKFNFIVNTAREISKIHNFREISTPIFEFSDVFERNLGDTSDVVTKEIYKFKDRSDNSLSLRPEFTAGIVRAILSNPELTNNFPMKLFSYGPLFRYERPQKGRYRQFNQINFEYFGNGSYLADVDVLQMANNILKSIGLKNISLEINSLGCAESRTKYEDVLRTYFNKYKNDLSDDSKISIENNILRILDSKEECDKKLLKDAPVINNFYTDDDRAFFDNILEKLALLGINFKVNVNLVRGLDYYTSTVFEFTTNDLGAQGTVFAGGRYDKLMRQMGGQDTPAVGLAAGVERLILLTNKELKENRPISIIPVDESEIDYCLKLKSEFLKNNVTVELVYANNMKKKMNIANKIDSKYTIIVGDEEVNSGVLTVKNMDKGIESKVTVEKIFDCVNG